MPQDPSRMTFSTGFRSTLVHLLLNQPWWLFSASQPGAPEALQNALFNGVSAHFGPFATEPALVPIFGIPAWCPRTLPEWPFQRGFGPLWSICRMAFSTGFRPTLVHLLLIWPQWPFSQPHAVKNTVKYDVSCVLFLFTPL